MEKNIVVLALDLGTSTGWALRSRSGLVSSGSQSFKLGRFDGAGMRFLRFKRWLTELKSGEGIDVVHFEEVRRHLGADAARCYGGFFGVLTAWCEHHEIPYSGVSVGTIKKFATGSGNASKDQMIAAARTKWSVVTDCDDEADAVALLHFCMDEKQEAHV